MLVTINMIFVVVIVTFIITIIITDISPNEIEDKDRKANWKISWTVSVFFCPCPVSVKPDLLNFFHENKFLWSYRLHCRKNSA